jgi:hypothetical protein
VLDLNAYLTLIERERQRRPAEAMLADEIHRLRLLLDETQLRSIEARNPGIDMDDVRRIRAGGA